MSSGILIVAYGNDYDRCAAHACITSRKNTKLPITVVSNLEKRNPAWDEIDDVNFIYRNEDILLNRIPKLTMPEITPYDKTLYLDADSVIQKPGIEAFINLLDDNDLILKVLESVKEGQRYYNIYVRCMKKFKVKKPITIHNGSVIAFKKCDKMVEFFKLWHKIWFEFNHGREMPPLNCAVKLFNPKLSTFPRNFYTDGEDSNCIVQHNYRPAKWNKKFNIPAWNRKDPNDKPGRNDFSLEPEDSIY